MKQHKINKSALHCADRYRVGGCCVGLPVSKPLVLLDWGAALHCTPGMASTHRSSNAPKGDRPRRGRRAPEAVAVRRQQHACVDVCVLVCVCNRKALAVYACLAGCLHVQVVVENATRECNQLLEVISTNTAEVETKAKAAVEKEAQLKIDSATIKVCLCVRVFASVHAHVCLCKCVCKLVQACALGLRTCV